MEPYIEEIQKLEYMQRHDCAIFKSILFSKRQYWSVMLMKFEQLIIIVSTSQCVMKVIFGIGAFIPGLGFKIYKINYLKRFL